MKNVLERVPSGIENHLKNITDLTESCWHIQQDIKALQSDLATTADSLRYLKSHQAIENTLQEVSDNDESLTVDDLATLKDYLNRCIFGCLMFLLTGANVLVWRTTLQQPTWP